MAGHTRSQTTSSGRYTTLSSFHEQDWQHRETLLGDEAEGVFREVAGDCVKYGLDRPPINLRHVPDFIRFTPDFLQASRAVEVVGMGQDGILKIKCNKMLALLKWNEHMPVFVFIWNSATQLYTLLPVTELWRRLLETGKIERFHEGNLAFFAPVDGLATGWGWHGK